MSSIPHPNSVSGYVCENRSCDNYLVKVERDIFSDEFQLNYVEANFHAKSMGNNTLWF